jgi:glycerol uptake facilitator-like aquaporin
VHSWPQRSLSECAGTFGVALIAAGAVAQRVITIGPLGIALAYGVAYALAVAALGRISGGHFNPAVTVAHWVTHRFGTFDALLYIAAQVAGATVAAYALRLVVPGATSATLLGPPVLASGVTRGPAMLIEGAMAFALVLALWTTLVSRPRPLYWLGGIVAGAAVAAASFAGAPYTGGVMNPALAFGPAMAAHLWGYQAIYWIGPLAGGVVAASLYDLLFRRRPNPKHAVLKGGGTQSGLSL